MFFALFYARRYDEAIEQCRKTLEMDSNFLLASIYIGLAYEQKGMYDEAFAEFEKVAARTKDGAGIAMMGHAYGLWGKRKEARKKLEELMELSKRTYVPAAHLAMIYLGLGDKERALKELEKAYEERSRLFIYFKSDPRSDLLRSDPRFRDMLQRVGLAP